MLPIYLAFYWILLLVLPRLFFANNPFTPPEDVQLFEQVLYPDTTHASIEYKMYLKSAGKNIALLNTTVVLEGDRFEGDTVLSINPQRVILASSTGERRVVVLHAMQSKVARLRTALEEQKNTVE